MYTLGFAEHHQGFDDGAACWASGSLPRQSGGQAFPLGAPQRVGAPLYGRAVLARGGLAPDLLRHSGRAALAPGQLRVGQQLRKRLGRLYVCHLGGNLLEVLLHWLLLLL